VINLQDRGAGLPDGGLFTADQFQRRTAQVRQGQIPSRGVIEVKPVSNDAWVTANGSQVTRYWGRYGLVLVTNYRDFVLVGRDADGNTAKLESYRLAENEQHFWRHTASDPRGAEQRDGDRFVAYLARVLLHEAPLREPQDVAWFLASYAREAKARIDAHPDVPALASVREAFEQALGITFTPEQGSHFFRSSLVQTLFYGVFSSWVLWSRRQESQDAIYDWRDAAWDLHVPMITALYERIATPTTLRFLGLEEVLDWTGRALNRVDRPAFFERFKDDNAVQYFYEPFLEAFDPELRKQLGVWYTPREVIRYQVARVDWALRHELGVADGLADENVYVLDPCCGTGGYLVEVLQRIGETLERTGRDALSAHDLKAIALQRVFGFELLPAPFVVAHLQLGLLLNKLGAPLDAGTSERVSVYLTNALTGWEPPSAERAPLLFPALEVERDLADGVKRTRRILVILGNPPYDNYAEIARVAEERSLSLAYRRSQHGRQPEGQGLNDPYVRFFRMAERRIVEMTGLGIVCYISNYSWLDGLSHPAMRERYLQAFDSIRVDSLNGDRNRTGKVTPDGDPDPSIFSTAYDPEGITVGTAVALLVRRQAHTSASSVLFREFWGQSKHADLLATAETTTDADYQVLTPRPELGYPFVPVVAQVNYPEWPSLPDLLPTSFAGVKTSRDDVLVDIDRDRLVDRIEKYFNPDVPDEEIRHAAPSLMSATAGFPAPSVRRQLQARGLRPDGFVRYYYRPFDRRWLYWDADTALLDRPRSEYKQHIFDGNIWLEARQRQVMDHFDRGVPVHDLADNMGNGLSNYFPLYLSYEGTVFDHEHVPLTYTPNLSAKSRQYLDKVECSAEDLFFHLVAVLNTPTYRGGNAGALRLDWPRIPLPADGQMLKSSATLGRRVAALFDSSALVPGVTTGAVRQEFRSIGVVSRSGGGGLDPAAGDLAITARWGRVQEGVVFPGQDSARERSYTDQERQALESGGAALGLSAERVYALLGQTTFDVPLNAVAFWSNVPERVWAFTVSNYLALKKWLSYRERDVLGRGLTPEEAREFSSIARRVAALLLDGPALDAGYAAVVTRA